MILPLLILLGIAAASQQPTRPATTPRAPTPAVPPPQPQAQPRRARRTQARTAPVSAPTRAQEVNEARAAVDSILQQSREVPTPTPTTPASAPARSQEIVDARAAVDSILQQSREVPAQMTPNETARALALHLRKTGSFGSKRKPDAIVAQAQRDLNVSPADGAVGPATRAAARRAGVTLPSRG